MTSAERLPYIEWEVVVVAKMPGHRGYMYYRPQNEHDRTHPDYYAKKTAHFVLSNGGSIVRIVQTGEIL